MIIHEYHERSAYVYEFSKDTKPRELFRIVHQYCIENGCYVFRINHNVDSQSYHGTPGGVLKVIEVVLLGAPYSFPASGVVQLMDKV